MNLIRIARSLRASSVAAIASLTLSSTAVATTETVTITLHPIRDTSLFERFPNNNFGGEPDLAAGTTASGHRSRALLRFNVVGALPPGAIVESAILRLDVTRIPTFAVPSTFGVHRLLVDWPEGVKSGQTGQLASPEESTWNQRIVPSAPWSAPGAGSSSDYQSTSSGRRFVTGLGTQTFASTTAMVADVQSWLDSPSSNFGWLLAGESEGTARTAFRFRGRESAGNGAALDITYSITINTPPTVGSLPAQIGPPGSPIQVTVQIADNETAASGLMLTASSTNPTLLPDANIALAGSGSQRQLTFTPQPGASGIARVTLTVSDGTLTAATSFLVIFGDGLEADVAPRPAGSRDGTVTVTDWVQIGRFAAGLDVPSDDAETRRADCAPKDTNGDGRITITDWVQAGRYAAGLDPVQVTGGP